MERSKTITTVGTLNVVFGILMLPWAFLSKLAVVMLWEEYDGFSQVLDTPSFMFYVFVYIPIGLIAAVALIRSGRGLLKFKRSARILSIIYGLYALAVTSVTLICCCVLWIPVFEEAGASDATSGDLVWELMGGTLGIALTVVYPVVLLSLMMLPSVKNVLQSR